MPLKAGVLGLYLQHSQEGNYYLCEHTHVNGNVEELGTAGWGGVEAQQRMCRFAARASIASG